MNSIIDGEKDVLEIVDTSAQQQATIIAGAIGTAGKSDQSDNTAPTKKEKPTTVKTETEPDQSPSKSTTTSTTKPTTDLIDLKKSGLVMIETTADKVEETTEEVTLPKRKRKRTKADPASETETLMQVETQK